MILKNSPYIVFLLGFALLSGCTKEGAIPTTVYKDTIINGNTPPPSSGVTRLQVSNYVRRAFIDLQGAEPAQRLIDAQTETIISASDKGAAKLAFTSTLTSSQAFGTRHWSLLASRLLEGIDSFDIARQTKQFVNVRSFAERNGETFLLPYYDLAIGKLNNLQSARSDFFKGTINLSSYYSRLMDNYFYDEINMGAENFVKASFENLFFRQPTKYELQAAVNMYNGGDVSLMNQTGAGQDDLRMILTNNREFEEGIVREAYAIYLQIKPSSGDVAKYANLIHAGTPYKTFIAQLSASTQYAQF